jgi:hypothetical protein
VPQLEAIIARLPGLVLGELALVAEAVAVGTGGIAFGDFEAEGIVIGIAEDFYVIVGAGR